jgi:hypothetical protein
MNFKTVKIMLLFTMVFLIIILVTPMFSANTHEKTLKPNFYNELSSDGHPTTMLIGDPVGGGTPCGNQTGV